MGREAVEPALQQVVGEGIIVPPCVRRGDLPIGRWTFLPTPGLTSIVVGLLNPRRGLKPDARDTKSIGESGHARQLVQPLDVIERINTEVDLTCDRSADSSPRRAAGGVVGQDAEVADPRCGIRENDTAMSGVNTALSMLEARLSRIGNGLQRGHEFERERGLLSRPEIGIVAVLNDPGIKAHVKSGHWRKVVAV
jgi:hypothetical protein